MGAFVVAYVRPHAAGAILPLPVHAVNASKHPGEVLTSFVKSNRRWWVSEGIPRGQWFPQHVSNRGSDPTFA